ncbi:MAG: hypothetical protein WC464_01790 [Bdellovibrionales bacterium]
MRKIICLTVFLALAALGSSPAVAQTTPDVAVRAASHDDYDRIVFDWPKETKFTFSREGAKAFLAFDAPAIIKFPKNLKTAVSRIGSFSVSFGENGNVTVSFTINPDAKIKAFANDGSVVVDVAGKVLSQPMVQPATIAVKPVVAEKQKPAPVLQPIATNEPQPLAAAVQSQTAPSPKAAPQQPVVAAAPTTDLLAPAAGESSLASKQPSFGFTLNNAPTLVATLDPRTKTRAVIYLRANVGYVVFDKKLTLSPSDLLGGIPAQIDLQKFDLQRYSAFRFPVPPNATLRATLDGTSWKLYLSKKQQDIPVTTSLVAQPDFALGARFLLPLPDGPEPIRLVDPVVGDDLVLVPLGQSEAFNVERRMSDFSILPAAQGLVIKPLTDKLIVRTVSDGVEITAEGGLILSRAADTGLEQQSTAKSKAAATGKSIFDFATWGGKPGETFIQTRQRLQQTIVDVPEAERNRARMELARLYFSKGMGEEAVSMLNFLEKEVPDLRAHDDFLVLLGAAKILAYRSEEGLNDILSSSLSDQPEVVLWQAVALAQMREWKKAEEKFASKKNVLTGYPEPFFSRFFVLAVESALAADQTNEAADWLNFVSASPHAESIDPALAFLRGVLNAKAGRAEGAEEAWKEARKSNDRLYKVRAELALIDLGVSNGSLTPAQAADRLEALRFGWRGDDLEVDILKRLGQFYIQSKNIKTGINVLSQAITLYPSSPLAPSIRAEMSTTLRDAILGNLGKRLSPLDTLTLYHQYRDLLPTGKEGNDIMISLSERLISVDLLDQASDILEDLAKNRLQGEDKVRAALRLAAIRLLDHKPKEALAALDIIGTDTLSETLQNERVLLHARALSELQRNNEAVALLKENSSPGAALLRADIAMRAQQWQEAGKILMEVVGPPPPEDKSLSDDQASTLINAAISYALADDQTSLDKLAIDYGAAMQPKSQNSTFLMLTQPEKTGQMRDLAAAQVQLSQVDMFQRFLNNYRNSLISDANKPATKE